MFPDVPCASAERDLSVFSLCLGLVSRFVKGQVLQERQYKMPKKYENPLSFSAKPGRQILTRVGRKGGDNGSGKIMKRFPESSHPLRGNSCMHSAHQICRRREGSYEAQIINLGELKK